MHREDTGGRAGGGAYGEGTDGGVPGSTGTQVVPPKEKVATRRGHHLWLLWAVGTGFAYQTFGGGAVVDRLGLSGAAVGDGEWWRLVTHGFLHNGVAHLALNMFALLVIGRATQELYTVGGVWRFHLLAATSLVGGGLGVLLLDGGRTAVGASGIVFGLLAAAATGPRRVGYGWNRLGVAPWIVLNLAVTFTVPNISVGGHLGGLLAGGVAGWLLVPVDRLEGPQEGSREAVQTGS